MSKIRGLNLMSEDALSQKRMWLSLNRVMERHGVSHPQFKGFWKRQSVSEDGR
jgi:hypothetical protein